MIYEINEKKYFIDVKNYSLNLLENPKIQLSFYDMDYVEDGYQVHFDTYANQILLNKDELNPYFYMQYLIPHLTTLVPNAVAKHYGLPINEVVNKTDYEVMLDKRDFFDYNDTYPIVNIEGQNFDVSFYSRCLIHQKNRRDGHEITFYDLDQFLNKKLNRFVFPYNQQTQRLEQIDLHKTTEIPNHLVLISIPFYDKLDPIGHAKEMCTSLGKILPKTPLKAVIVAKKIPWDKTYLPELFRKKKELLAKEQNEQTKKGRTHKM